MAVHQPVGGAALAIFALHHQLVLRPNTSLNFPMRLTLRFRAIEEIARRLVLHKNRSASSSSLCLAQIVPYMRRTAALCSPQGYY